MNGRQETEDKQFQFLRYLYEHEGETKLNWFESLDVGRFLGYTDDETEQVVRYLLKAGSVEHRGGSGKQILISLTQQGRNEARAGSLGPRAPGNAAGVYAPHSDAGSSTARGQTPSQKKDYDTHGFKCQDEIRVTGGFDNTGRNVVAVNETEVLLGPKQLRLLLVFVNGSKNNEEGWVDLDELKPTGFNPRGNKYQPLSVLRQKIQQGLRGSDPKDLFEIGYNQQGQQRYRLSTHPDFVTCEKGKLLNHPDDDIKRLATKLP